MNTAVKKGREIWEMSADHRWKWNHAENRGWQSGVTGGSWYRTNSRAGLMHVKCTDTNTHVSVSWVDEKGMSRCMKSSAGLLAYKGSKRGTSDATQSVVRQVCSQLRKEGVKNVHIRLNGSGRGRGLVGATVLRMGYTVLTVSDTTPEPHAGCRGKKMRRV